MPPDPGSPNRPSLNSWKEIAQFFGREVRTVQRWEKEESLPVHRHMHRRQSSVYAYRDELETWWRERGAALRPPEMEEPQQTSVSEPAPPSSRHRLWRAAALFAVLTLLAGTAVMISQREPASRAAALPVIQLEMEFDKDFPPSGPFIADVNGDGAADLMATIGGRNEAYILFGGALPAASRPLHEAARVKLSSMERGSWTLADVGDFNADGIADLLFSKILLEPESYTATGPMYIVFGRRQWPASMRLPEEADVKLTLNWKTDARLNGCPAPHPIDLNQDGIADVVLGAQEYGTPERVSAGAIFVLYGRKTWPRQLEVAAAADVTILGSRTGEGLAGGCAAGDFNGDGLTDLAVNAGESTLWNLRGAHGRVYVFTGSKSWPRRVDAASNYHFRVDGERRENRWTQVAMADVNGDGRDDLLFARPTAAGGGHSGDLLVFLGGRGRDRVVKDTGADVILTGPSPGVQLGHGLSTADIDGDGCHDVLLAESTTGRILALPGCSDWPARGSIDDARPMELIRGPRGSGLGRIALGDLDQDSLPELATVAWWSGAQREVSAGPAMVARIYHRVSVDVRPEHTYNVVLHPGVVVARMYGILRGDGEQIDPDSLRWAGAKPTHTVVQDFNGDGIPDVQAQFQTAEIGIPLDSTRARIIARTRSGKLVAGSDTIVVVPLKEAADGAVRGKRSADQ